jgi:hypothetical protein
MGQPTGRNGPVPLPEPIGQEEGTRGTETSKYPQEKKERSISSVAASERERAQTIYLRINGVVGSPTKLLLSLAEAAWKGPP